MTLETAGEMGGSYTVTLPISCVPVNQAIGERDRERKRSLLSEDCSIAAQRRQHWDSPVACVAATEPYDWFSRRKAVFEEQEKRKKTEKVDGGCKEYRNCVPVSRI
ncbi:hypothetical protein BHE74_00023263 [Ensete ventricosum]|nr:hypothetical protein GW17_00019904 [Ensete ventricosum]RWW69158.1 hypothetical protein BHE74_00023263 [Ensete ventricosum]